MFGGFKATLNLLGGNRKNSEISELSSDLSVTGAYRVNREDVYGFSTQDAPKSRPSKQLSPPLRTAKSTSNLVQASTANPNLRNSTPTISRDPRGAEQADRSSALSRKEIKNQEKEQKKLEKQRLANQKKRAQDQAKQEKLAKEQVKNDVQKAKSGRKPKTQAPQPRAQPQTQPQTQPRTQPQPQNSNPVPLQPAYSTNTLDSSISKSSGPPPYSETPKPQQSSKDTGNVVFSKPVDNGSWDIISQHREQMNRPTASASMEAKRKQVVMDLNYNFGANSDKINSEA